MKYIFSGVTSIDKYPLDGEDIVFTNPNEANKFLQNIYKEIDYAAPLIDKITEDEVRIVIDII